jgi:phospholipid/cholesterol/gamma-HCH transport system substrate-binding protein
MKRIGLLLAAVGLLAAGCSLPGRVSGPFAVVAEFEDVNDLVVNHGVQVADVRVGSVTRIELTDDLRRARVTMHVKDGLGIPDDAVAVLRQTSLLGEKFIELRPRRDDDECGESAPPDVDDDVDLIVTCTLQAPELEVVTEEAVQILGAVMTNDLRTLVDTGALGFGGRGEELRSIIGDLGTVSATLADQTTNILSILDGLDAAAGTLAAGASDLDGLLVNLGNTVALLTENRQQAIDTLTALTRLARDQNDLVFEPHLEATSRQIQELDAILTELHNGKAEVGSLLDWLINFIGVIPRAIPCDPVGQPATDEQPACNEGDFAQIYGWLIPAPLEPAP